MFSIVTGYLNWAFCLVACALFVPFNLLACCAARLIAMALIPLQL